MNKNFPDKLHEKTKYLADLKADITQKTAMYEYIFDFVAKLRKGEKNIEKIRFIELSKLLSKAMLNIEIKELQEKIKQGEEELVEMLKNE